MCPAFRPIPDYKEASSNTVPFTIIATHSYWSQMCCYPPTLKKKNSVQFYWQCRGGNECIVFFVENYHFLMRELFVNK